MSSVSLSPAFSEFKQARIYQVRLDAPVEEARRRVLWGEIVGTLILRNAVIPEDNMPTELREVSLPVIGEEEWPVRVYLVQRDPVAVELERIAAQRGHKLLRYAAFGMGLDPQVAIAVPKNRVAFVPNEAL